MIVICGKVSSDFQDAPTGRLHTLAALLPYSECLLLRHVSVVVGRQGGFFWERWGDAPVHTLAAAMFLGKSEVCPTQASFAQLWYVCT